VSDAATGAASGLAASAQADDERVDAIFLDGFEAGVGPLPG